eukprot:TRINITY_DN2801_c0_g1_i2.p1 TRINITY_DN2801_c0_g1~~TRINITY_DN2801_c0_g1_i2.p1  ORF type:complete len:317 (-),score=72.75 TRINITY_DN2801_c0_g1_i2:57-1007(-)
MTNIGKSVSLVIGTPRGFTRSVLEALLKRGSKVLFACSDESAGSLEHDRLRSLYGPQQVFYSAVDQTSSEALESVFLRALDTLGEISCVVSSTANDPLDLGSEDLQGDMAKVERKLDSLLVKKDVNSMRQMGHLATKYMGRQNGFQGGTLLNLTSSVELNGSTEAGGCTVLGTTRALGLEKRLAIHGVRALTVYQPSIDYPDLSQATQITDDQHSPYSEWDKYSSYTREYTGYMALHVGETGAPGTAWAFNKELRLKQVLPEDVPGTCGITNKMCFWLGCPMVKEEEMLNNMNIEEKIQTQSLDEIEMKREDILDT